MSADIHLCGVILAAGASLRMGRDKALLAWPHGSQSTLLSAAITALKPFAETVIVVAGNNTDKLEPIAKANGAELVRNPAPERGQFSSLQTGLRAALDRGCTAVMIAPVDCPPLSAESLKHLCVAFEQAVPHGVWAVAPENSGRHGHPLLADRPLIDVFLHAPAMSNAREVKRDHEGRFRYLPVSDAFLNVDLNTPEEYARAAAHHT